MERGIVSCTGVRAPIVTVLAGALALLPAAAAQGAGSSPTPPRQASAAVRSIYSDYSADGTLGPCDHAKADLQTAYDTMTPAVTDDFPGFRDQVEQAIAKHKAHGCADDAAGTTAVAPAASTPTPTPATTPESGQLPPAAQDDGGGALPPDQAATPIPSATVPLAATPPPESAPVAATPSPAVVAEPAHRDVTLPAVLIGLALLGAAALALSAVAGRRSPGVRHAWREAGFRARATWADFSDWLRLGR